MHSSAEHEKKFCSSGPDLTDFVEIDIKCQETFVDMTPSVIH